MNFMNFLTCCALAIGIGTASAQENTETQESLKIFFETGSSRIPANQQDMLDEAARLFRDGDPLVMIISGVADTVGDPKRNLSLSLLRAQAVATGLTDRGIPAARLQILGRGNSELEVETEIGVEDSDNRIAEITWR